MSVRIGLFGGSFDPIHLGHLIVARAIAEDRNLLRVVLLPSAAPPHKIGICMTDGSRRAEMIRMSIQGESLFELNEFDLLRDGPTYTVDTVAHFQAQWGALAELFWIIGGDSLIDLGSWRLANELVDSCTILTAKRPGHPDWDLSKLDKDFTDERLTKLKSGIVNTPMVDISATQIRERVRLGRSIRYFVAGGVEQYIQQQNLYRS